MLRRFLDKFWVRALLLVAALGGVTVAVSLAQPKPDPDAYPKALAEDARAAVLAALKDPTSAQFRNITWSTGIDGPAICGEVNSKNSWGGYTGAQRFVRTFSTNEARDLENAATGDPSLADTARSSLDLKRSLATIENEHLEPGHAPTPTSQLVTEEQLAPIDMTILWGSRCSHPSPISTPNAFAP